MKIFRERKSVITNNERRNKEEEGSSLVLQTMMMANMTFMTHLFLQVAKVTDVDVMILIS